MPGVRNPTVMRWSHDGKNTDGSNVPANAFQGWEVAINGAPSVAIPIGWQESDGSYEAPIASLNLKTGDYVMTLRLVTTYGASGWSAPVEFEVRAQPTSPLSFSVA